MDIFFLNISYLYTSVINKPKMCFVSLCVCLFVHLSVCLCVYVCLATICLSVSLCLPICPVADPGFARGGGDMVTTEHEPIMGICKQSPKEGLG